LNLEVALGGQVLNLEGLGEFKIQNLTPFCFFGFQQKTVRKPVYP
jgi:hypothetical protein